MSGVLLFTREMNNAISKALRTSKSIRVQKALRDEISHWLFLRTWDDPLPRKDERHFRISLATDASASGWGGSLTLSDHVVEVSDYWTEAEQGLDISTKEALALDKIPLSFPDSLRNAWVDGWLTTRQWSIRGNDRVGRVSLNGAIKKLFFTTAKLNISLHLSFILTGENEADTPSCQFTTLDCKLHPHIWAKVQEEFGGQRGHACDLMALDSNVMTDRDGSPLPHFTPHPSPQSLKGRVGEVHPPHLVLPLTMDKGVRSE